MSTDVLYHGTNGDNILSIIKSGEMRSGADGKVFFARFRWDSALMHGPDSKRGASFVVKVEIELPDGAVRSYESTKGVNDTLVIITTCPIPTKVLELHVRVASRPFVFKHIIGEERIKAYLTTSPQA